MSRARADFLKRLEEVDLVLSDESVKDGLLTEAERNAKARVLRNGLAVVLFAVLEDFIRQRTSEVLLAVGSTGVMFAKLPVKLRTASTTGLLGTLMFRLKLQEESQRLAFLQREAARIVSTGSSPYELSPFSLAHSKSNLDSQEIKDVLAAFLVEDAWGAMTKIASRLNFGALPLEDVFDQAAVRRHAAAHQAGAQTLLPELQEFVTNARAIASSFDCLLSRAFWLIKTQNADYMVGKKINASNCRIRRVEQVGGKWKQYVEGRARAVAVGADRTATVSGATAAAIADGDFVVIADGSSRPVFWAFPAA